jgi:hypothetical protein
MLCAEPWVKGAGRTEGEISSTTPRLCWNDTVTLPLGGGGGGGGGGDMPCSARRAVAFEPEIHRVDP